MTWFCISVKGRYLGKVQTTLAALLAELGSYVTVEGNHVNVWGPS